jgi:hypothetical protein
MRKSLVVLIIAVSVATAVPAFADLQNVVVGGSIRMRANWFDYGDSMNSNAFVEQNTKLNVRADFTDAVSAFIEFDDYENWGDDFRSNYLTGIDSRADSSDDVEVYQAYIDANEMWGTALKARIGRQEIKLGSGFLVGNNSKNAYFRGLSFDGIRLTYATDQFSVEGLYAKLAENSPLEEDGDIDMYGVYGSYLGIENVTLDAYWLFIRDAQNFDGSLDTHTFGLRGAGTFNAFDFEAEAAYQLLDLDDADNSDAFAANLEVGYTFDMDYTPRVFLGGAYFEGDDEDMPFNRLFSNWEYSMFDFAGENMNANMTNFWTGRAGVSVMPTETVKLALAGGYLALVEDFGGDKDLGWEIDASVAYAYTKDLSFEAGYSHFFTGDAVADDADDFNYFYAETKICF